MKKQRLALLLASIWMIGGLAHADTSASSSWYVVPEVGGLLVDKKLETDNTAYAGIKLGTELTPHIDMQIGATTSLEADVDYPAKYSGGSYRQSTISIEALYMFSRGSVRPFLSAGAGAAFDKFDYVGVLPQDNASGSKTYFQGSVGAGVQFAFSDTGFVQGSVKYAAGKVDFSNNASIDIGKVANVYAGLGIGFRFGKAPEAAPVPVVIDEPTPAPVVPVAGLNVCEDTGSCKQPVVVVVAPPEVKPVAPVVTPKQKILTKTLRADASFAIGKSILTKKGKKAVDAAIASEGLTYAKLSNMPDLELQVVGHASRPGSDAFNQKLSMARAESVKKYLVSKGLAADSIKAEGRGESEPVTSGECDALKGKKKTSCYAVDRRVELFGQANVVAK